MSIIGAPGVALVTDALGAFEVSLDKPAIRFLEGIYVSYAKGHR